MAEGEVRHALVGGLHLGRMVVALEGKRLPVTVLFLGISEVQYVLELFLYALIYRLDFACVVRVSCGGSLVLRLLGDCCFRIIIVKLILWEAIGIEEGDIAGMRLHKGSLGCLRLAMRTWSDVGLGGLFGDRYI